LGVTPPNLPLQKGEIDKKFSVFQFPIHSLRYRDTQDP